MQLYDMHTHILPAFDDGAKTVEDSLALIECLKKQGVSHICLTPHFYTHEMSVEDYVAKRQEAFEVLRPQLPSDVEIVLGSEVYVTQYLFNSQDLNGITYGQSNYILVEFSYQCTFNETIMRQFDVLMRNHRLIPVLTHVERYDNLMSDPGLIEELKDDGVVIQTNISNYADKAPFFRKRKLLKFISNAFLQAQYSRGFYAGDEKHFAEVRRRHPQRYDGKRRKDFQSGKGHLTFSPAGRNVCRCFCIFFSENLLLRGKMCYNT